MFLAVSSRNQSLILFFWIWYTLRNAGISVLGYSHVASIFDVLDSNEVLYFQSGQTLSRTCWSVDESGWVLPENDQYRQEDEDPLKDGRASITATRTKSGWFKVKLVIRDLRYTDTGFYTCRSKSSIFDDISNYSGSNPQSTRIYVLVSSSHPYQVFLHRKDDTTSPHVRQVPVWRNRDSFVPCLVVRRDVDLVLKIDGVADRDHKYDPRYGFLLPANSLGFDEIRSGRCVALTNVTGSDGTVKLKIVDRVQVLLIPIEHTELLKPIVQIASDLPYKNGPLKLSCLYPGDVSKPEIAFINCSWSHIPTGEGVKLISAAANKTVWIPKLDMKHRGNYTCTCHHVLDSDRETTESHFVDVSPTKGRLFYLSPFGPTAAYRSVGATIEFSVLHIAWPRDEVKIQWFHRYKNAFSKFEIVELSENRQSSILRLNNLRVNHTGIYAFRILVGGDLQREVLFSLLVRGSPSLPQIFVTKAEVSVGNLNETGIEDSRFLEFNKHYYLYCISDGFPLPQLKILWNPCVRDSETPGVCEWVAKDENDGRLSVFEGDFQKTLILNTTARRSGRYKCEVTDSENSTLAQQTIVFIVSNISRSQHQKALSLTLITEDTSGEIYQTDSVVAVCRFQPLIYTNVRWVTLSNRTWIPAGTYRDQSEEHTLLASSKNLTFTSISPSHAGTYACLADYAPDMGNGTEVRQFEISISQVSPLYLGNSTSPQVQTVNLGYPPVEIYCDARGAPKPDVTWLKDNQLFQMENGSVADQNIQLLNDSRLLVIRRPTAGDGATYTCVIKNRFEIIHADFYIRISSVFIQGIFSYWVIGLMATALVLLSIVSCFLLVCLALSKRKKKSARAVQISHLRQLYVDLMSSVDEGMELNPDQPVNEQIENLPYDRKYEIALAQLTIGRLLGEGQYGRVYEGVLKGTDGQNSVVAVKTPKSGTNLDQQKALLSEFKIMIYIENHVNVLRLLGAVTKQMVDGRLYVVVEYCRLGSLGDYLKRHRDRFVDELIHSTAPEDAYQSSVDVDGYLVPNTQNSGSTQSGSDGGCRQSYRAELDPSWNKKMGKDRHRETRVSTSDLLSYAYQVANGMDFLASKKIIHRDLAVRNLLLNENKVVKICDFGLARQDYAYHMTKVGVPLPVKWMAVESILYQEYTVKSDVWSFGVVTWEIFSLGQSPYPGQAVDRNFIRWLRNEENRMPCPDYAPEKIYAIMRQCWLSIPDDRPAFSDCRRRIGRELLKCSSDYYRELQNVIGYHEDTESDSIPGPAACQRFNSSQSEDNPRALPSKDGNTDSNAGDDTAMNLTYFDCFSDLKGDEGMEMVQLNAQEEC